MSYWQDQYSAHPIHQELVNLIMALENPGCAVEEPVSLAKLSKSIRITQYVQQVLEQIDPEFISFSLLGSLHTQIKAAKDQIVAFSTTKQVQHLDQAIGNYDSIITNCAYLISPLKTLDTKTSVQSFQKLSTASESAIKNIVEAHKAADVRLADIDSKMTEFLQKIQQYGTSIDEVKNQASEFIRTSKDAHAENERNAKESIAKLISDKQKEILEEIKGFASSASECLDDLNDQFEEAKKLVGAIGNTGMTGHYQKMADQERERADTQRKFAYSAMVVMLIFAGFTIWNITHAEWTVSALRLLALAIISFPAGYAIRESSKHRQYERTYRRAELELAALGPFISQLPEADQQTIKKDLSGKYFGQQESSISGDDGKYEGLVDRGFTMLEKIVNKKI